ncbi:MAG: glycerol-3-phosphate 1-O-acyltransferase PlsY [Dehalococcoidia bacterium]|jgi:glycerol-3-phosphate acyltransferase PlsY|nr:glycerol-3-phosphate 1-O-acyltransferase PlsY [Dehalococcoidia bacterium]
MIVIKLLVAMIIGYLLGSIPFGVIVSKLQAKVDIRNYGSGRTGGTNVLRTLGRKAFVLVVAGDLLKAAVAVLLAGWIMGDSYFTIGHITLGYAAARAIVGICAIMGHIFPIFARFKGGRGVATFIGGLAAIHPVAALFGSEVLIIGAGLSGFASLGSLISVFSAYALMILLTVIYGVPFEYLIYTLFGTIIIVIAHRDNIKRLLAGKERKLNQKTAPDSSATP